MATAWPVAQDVKNYLRIGDDPSDDDLVSTDLAAAIAWTTARVGTKYTDPNDPNYVGELPDPLFTVSVMEAGRLYRRRDSVDGTVGWGDMGVVRVGPKDPDIETLIASYLVIVFG